MIPRTSLVMACTASSPTPRPETSVRPNFIEKPGRNRNASNSVSLSVSALSLVVSCRATIVSRIRQVDPSTVVHHGYLQQAGIVPRFEPDETLFGFPCREALLRRFEPMVYGVAQQMPQRCIELLKYVAVDAGRAAYDIQPHPFAERTTEITDHSRIVPHAVFKRPHPARQRFVVQSVGKIGGFSIH